MIRIECKMINIEKSTDQKKTENDYVVSAREREREILPNPMTFTNCCMTTDTIVLIRYPNN